MFRINRLSAQFHSKCFKLVWNSETFTIYYFITITIFGAEAGKSIQTKLL